MADVAIAFWIVTILGGLYMAGILLRVGKPGSTATTTRIPAWVVFSHGSAAVAGLAVWIGYLVYDGDGAAWAAVGLLVVTVVLGTAMFVRWVVDHHGAPEKVEANRTRLAEQQIPSIAVHGHGAVAAVTVVLAVLVALGLGS